MLSTLTVAIIAGGKSSRMGTDKSFVPLLGKPMIERVIERVTNLGQAETILVTNKPELYRHLELPMVGDVLPDKGSLGGIYTAIYASNTPYTLAVACDMPFLNPQFLSYLLTLRDEPDGPYDVIVPRQDGYPESLHAVYGNACLEPIRQRLAADQLKISGFFEAVRVRYVDEQEYVQIDPLSRSFRNINTPDELRDAEQNANQ